MRQPSKGTALRRHIFLPYIVVVLTMVAVMCAWLSFQNAHDIETENRSMLGNLLGTTAEQVDTMFEELDAVSYDILQNRALYPYTAFSSGYYAMLASDELMSYRTSNVYLSDIILYYDDSASFQYNPSIRFLSSNGVYDADTFWKWIHPLDGWTNDAFQTWATTLCSPQTLFPIRENHRVSAQDYLLYVTPALQVPAAVNDRGCVIFMIARQYLDDLFSQISAQYQGSLVILDSQGTPIYYTADAPRQTLPDGFDVSSLQPQFFQMENGGLSLALRTATRDCTYLLDFPKKPYPSPYLAAFIPQLPLLALLLLLGIAYASTLAQSIYRPIFEVSQMLPRADDQSGETLKGIVDSVREMHDRNEELEKQIARQRELSIVQHLRSLLYHNYASADALLEQLYGLGLRLYSPRHIVLTGRLHADSGLMEKREGCISAIVAMHKPCYVIPLDVPSDIAVLCGLENGQDERQAAAAIHYQLRSALKGSSDLISLGCSQPFSDVLQAHEAFRDSQESLSGIFLLGLGALLPPPDHDSVHEDGNWYPLPEEEALQHALRQGDESNARQIADGMADLIRRKCHSSHEARLICQSVVRHLLTALDDHGLVGPLYAVQDRLNRPSETLASFSRELDGACSAICQLVRSRQSAPSREKLLSARVEEFLHERFAVSALSMADVAAHFDLSEGYLARTFKAQTGGSIMQRLSAIRLAHAQQLLRQEDLPLDEIIAQCGYVDKSHFIRTFKKACFVTPMQYRKLSRENAKTGA